MTRRPFDVVLWGCTGFTGQLVARYFANRVAKRVPSLKWALAGRSLDKLQNLADSLGGVDVLVADVQAQADVDKVAASTRVVLSTAGPFALYGTPLVDACIRSCSDYVDINGETGWHRSMIDQYDDAAQRAGVVLVPSSGFDSIPSDLGALWMARRVFEASGLPTRRVSCYAEMHGALSGGTVASGINSELSAGAALDNPFLLGGEPWSIAGAVDPAHDDLTHASFDPVIKAHVAPFGMAKINTRIVRRSIGLLEEHAPTAHAEIFSPDFCYRECLLAPDEAAAIKMARAAQVPPSKLSDLVAAGRLPAPGGGPDAATRDKSWFRYTLIAEADGPAGASGNVSFKLCGRVSGGDPGYDETAKMVSETAVMLATQRGDLDEEGAGLVQRAGFLTPATALGARLRERLHEEGIRFDEQPLPPQCL